MSPLFSYKTVYTAHCAKLRIHNVYVNKLPSGLVSSFLQNQRVHSGNLSHSFPLLTTSRAFLAFSLGGYNHFNHNLNKKCWHLSTHL